MSAEATVILIISFVDSLGATITTPMLPLYAKYFNATNSEIGLVYSAFAVATLVCLPIQGFMCKSIGRKPTILISLVGTSAGCVWQGLAPSFTSLICARAFSGAWAAVAEACQIYMNDLNEGEFKLKRMTTRQVREANISLQASRQLAAVLGPGIGGVLSTVRLDLPVLVQGLASLALFAVALCILKEPASSEQEHRHDEALLSPGEFEPTFGVTKNPSIGMTAVRLVITVFGAVSLSGITAWMSITSTFPIYVSSVFRLEPKVVGVIFTACAVAQLVATKWLSKWLMTSYLEVEGTGILGSLVLMIGAQGILAPSLPACVAFMMIATMGNAITNAAVTAYYNSLTDASSNITVVTSISMTRKFGAILGPVIAGHLADINTDYPFNMAAVAALTSAFLSLASKNQIREVKALKDERRSIGLELASRRGKAIDDEAGTVEEVLELGNQLAGILKKRHWQWVTYSNVVPQILDDVFVELEKEDAEDNFRQMRWVQLHAANFRARNPATRPPVCLFESVPPMPAVPGAVRARTACGTPSSSGGGSRIRGGTGSSNGGSTPAAGQV